MEPYCPLGTTRCIPQAKLPRKPYYKSFIDRVCSVKMAMAGYWSRSFFASLWISTSSRSINTQKKNLANIHSSWPHSWSITYTYVVNEHHVIRKSHDATQKKMSSRGGFQCTTWMVWNKLAASKTLLWRRQKKSWVSRSTGKSNA